MYLWPLLILHMKLRYLALYIRKYGLLERLHLAIEKSVVII